MEKFWKRLSFQLNPYHQMLLQVEQRGFEHPDLQKLFVNSDMVKREILHYYDVNPKKSHLSPMVSIGKGFKPLFSKVFKAKPLKNVSVCPTLLYRSYLLAMDLGEKG